MNHYELPAFAEGERAAKSFNATYGSTAEDYPNPYEQGTDEFRAWNLGWNTNVRR